MEAGPRGRRGARWRGVAGRRRHHQHWRHYRPLYVDPVARSAMTARRKAQQRLVDAEVVAGVASGRFRAPFAREASRTVVTMCTSIAEWYRPAGPPAPEDVAWRYVRLALGMVEHTGSTGAGPPAMP